MQMLHINVRSIVLVDSDHHGDGYVTVIGGSLKSPYLVLLAFLPQNFGRWQGPTNCHFAQKGMQLQWC